MCDEEGQCLLWVPKERRYLLWVPLADHYGGLREEMLAPARKDICGNYDLWDFVEHARHLPPYGQGFQPFLAVWYQTVAMFNERVGRARPWEFGVRRARSGVPTLVSRRG